MAMHVGVHPVYCRLSAVCRDYASLTVKGERKTILEFQSKRRQDVAVKTYGRGYTQSWIANVVVALITVSFSSAAHVVLFMPRANIGVSHKRGIRLNGTTGT